MTTPMVNLTAVVRVDGQMYRTDAKTEAVIYGLTRAIRSTSRAGDARAAGTARGMLLAVVTLGQRAGRLVPYQPESLDWWTPEGA